MNPIRERNMFNIVLFNPQIPQNTGNIARTCAVSGTALHLIEPFGFSINDKNLKRAGLDYWSAVAVYKYTDFQDFIGKNKDCNLYLITTKSKKNYSDFSFKDNDYFMFGSETSGLPDYIHDAYKDSRLRIPMRLIDSARCLNLSNAVNIILYEALRQNDFFDLK